MKKIVFVCTGNTCRSPIAEAILKNYLPEHKDAISSYGTHTIDETYVSQTTAELIKERLGLDYSKHKTKIFSRDLIDKDTLFLTMTEQHKNYLLTFDPTIKVFTLKEFADLNGDIEDPLLGPKEVYKNVFDEIKICIDKALLKLKNFLE
ncbi:MAG: low molecular weight protein arginine phosphatase [Candidatus Hydrogenedentota bacterium]